MLMQLMKIRMVKDETERHKQLDDAAGSMSSNSNPAVIALLSKPKYAYLRRWKFLSHNPAAVNLLEAHQDRIDYDQLCKNPKAKSLVQTLGHLSKSQLRFLSQNQSQWAMEMIEPYLKKLKPSLYTSNIWRSLSANRFAVHLMEKHPECVDIETACLNSKAIHIVKSRLDDPGICWCHLSSNKAAIDLLRANPKKINWISAAYNGNLMQLWDEFKDKIVKQSDSFCWRHPDMFVPVVDYQAIRDRHVGPVYFSEVLKELMALYYHPSRMDPETFDLDGTKSVFTSKRKRSV